MKSKALLVFLGVFVILAAAFLLLDFHAAVNNNRVESNSGTARSSATLPDAIQQREPITLAITGEGPLVGALQKAIEKELPAAGVGSIEFVSELDPAYDHPAMRIDVGKPGVTWTPVYATSRFTVEVGYASNGDTARLEGTPYVFSSEAGPEVVMTSEYRFNGLSWGILSRPGYYQILADELAKRISESMKSIYLGA